MRFLWYSSFLFVVSTMVAQNISSLSPTDNSTEESIDSENILPDEQKKGSATILGSVIDQSSREPIANAKVTIIGTKFVSTTTADGQYKIESVPEGIYQLKAEAESYERQIINNVYLVDGKKTEYQFFTLKKADQEPADFVPVEKQPTPIKESMAAPVYPEIARRAGVEGTVWLKLWVDTEGKVRKTSVLKSDNEILIQPSIDAAMKWKFEPAMLKGVPVSVWVSIPFKFREYFKEEELDKLPQLISSQPPKYPASARKQNLEGEFWLNVSIDEKGNVLGAYVLRLRVTDKKTVIDTLSEELKMKLSEQAYSAVNEMSNEAVNAVKQWKFSPGTKNKNAVKARLTVPVKFSLNSKKKK